MKIGIIDRAYLAGTDRFSGFAKMKEHGYDCVDYGVMTTEIEPYTLSGAEYDEYVGEIRDAAQKSGIVINQVHGPWVCPPHDSTEEDRAERLDKMKFSMKFAKDLGSKYWVIHPFMPFGCDREGDRDEFMRVNRECFGELIKEGEKLGVIVCIENMPFSELPLTTPYDMAEFVREMNSPYLRACLDTGHCLALGLRMGDCVRALGKYLAVLHVHDNPGRDWHWIPFTGNGDWLDFKAALHEVGFDGVLSLETEIKKKEMPDDIFEYMQIGLAKMARFLAE